MSERNNFSKSVIHTIRNLVHGVRLSGVTAQSRQQGLSIFLWAFLACLVLIFLVNLFPLLPLPQMTRQFLLDISPVSILGLSILILLNRSGYTRIAGLIFLVVVTLIMPVAIPFAVLNQTIILFTLPVIAASFIIMPPASILIASLSALGYTFSWANTNHREFYNYPSVIVLFIISFAIWQVSARAEKAIRNMRKSEHKLQSEIKERRETEEKLEQRNRDLSTLLDSLPGFAFFKDTNFRYITANQTFCDAVGCPKDQLRGKTDFDFLPEPAAKSYRAADIDIFRTNQAILDIEMEMRDPHGPGRILVATRKVPLHDDEGQIIGLIGLGYDITARKIAERELRAAHDELVSAYSATLEGWARALEMREEETAGHCERVVDMTIKLAQRLNLCEGDCLHIQRGAFLHDIGKMGIPDNILLKPGPLDDKEWRVMRMHPQMAYDLLFPIEYLRPALDIPYCHHEKWDGSGYPRGLKGEEIPYAARIFSIVDVWDALISDRPYRKAWPKEKVFQYIKEQSGVQFDPRLVNEFLEMYA